MAKKRKQKKQAKKFQQKHMPAASQIGNEQAAIAEAFQSATSEASESSKSAPAKKSKPEPKKKAISKSTPAKAKPKTQPAKKVKTKKPKNIIFFGFKPKKVGNKQPLIHAVIDDKIALCDSRIVDLEFSGHSAEGVTCKSCLSNSVYKKYLEDQKDDEPKEVKTEGNGKAPETGTNEPEATDEDTSDIDDMFETLKNIMNARIAKVEKRLMSKMEKFCQELLEGKPEFFITRKANNMCQIVHDPSRYVIIENIKESYAEEALIKLMAIEAKWNGQCNPPAEWLANVRKISEDLVNKIKDARKPKRVLKRRPKPSLKRRKDRAEKPRKIKRRQK